MLHGGGTAEGHAERVSMTIEDAVTPVQQSTFASYSQDYLRRTALTLRYSRVY